MLGRTLVLLLGVVCAGFESAAQSVDEGTAAPDAQSLVQRAVAGVRGETTTWRAHVTVEGSGGSAIRELTLEVWDDRRHDRAFLRIVAPTKQAGRSFLKLPPNVWQYDPRSKEIGRIPPARMLQPWFRSDFCLDDWLHVSDEIRDYRPAWMGVEVDPDGRTGVAAHRVELVPREDADVAWGRIELWIESEQALPLRSDFFDRKGRLARTLRYDDFREVDGRLTPHAWVMAPAGGSGRKTRVALERVAFDVAIDEAVFGARNLKGAPPE